MYYIINLSQDGSKINRFLSNTLLKKIEESLKRKEKIILYINKRWEYSSLVCKDCQKNFKCPNCDISLSIHKNPPLMMCHTCWYKREIFLRCPFCQSVNLENIWVGTEQIERDIKKLFKEANILRFDFDSIKNVGEKKEALQKIKEADIIIGTKMISTWFDLQNIALIGIILLEQELSLSHYKQEEKVYQNIKQLIGRGERLGWKTEILIQTFIPENDIVESICEKNYNDFFQKSLKERKLFHYPPFYDFTRLEYRDINKEKAFDFIKKIKNKLDLLNKEQKYEIILSPEPRKKYNQFHYQIIIKWENNRNFLENIKEEIMRNKNFIAIFD